MSTCSSEVRKRLYDRSLWDKKTKMITAVGKCFSFVNIIMILFGVLQIGNIEFLIGIIVLFYFLSNLLREPLGFFNQGDMSPVWNPFITGGNTPPIGPFSQASIWPILGYFSVPSLQALALGIGLFVIFILIIFQPTIFMLMQLIWN